jgi:hypothetical protein
VQNPKTKSLTHIQSKIQAHTNSNRYFRFTMKNTQNIHISALIWGSFIGKLLSTGNRLFYGLFGTLMLPLLILAIIGYITGFISAPPSDIDGIREPLAGSLLYGNNWYATWY